MVAVATGGDGRLHVYDTRTLEKRATLDIGDDADNVRYDGLTDTLTPFGSTTWTVPGRGT